MNAANGKDADVAARAVNGVVLDVDEEEGIRLKPPNSGDFASERDKEKDPMLSAVFKAVGSTSLPVLNERGNELLSPKMALSDPIDRASCRSSAKWRYISK